jgi:hypothetical protein
MKHAHHYVALPHVALPAGRWRLAKPCFFFWAKEVCEAHNSDCFGA